jgi:hypothetical protein
VHNETKAARRGANLSPPFTVRLQNQSQLQSRAKPSLQAGRSLIEFLIAETAFKH